jgi:hypothetical protein
MGGHLLWPKTLRTATGARAGLSPCHTATDGYKYQLDFGDVSVHVPFVDLSLAMVTIARIDDHDLPTYPIAWRRHMIEILGAGWVRFVFEQAVDMRVFLVGDFNGWDEESHQMELQEDGTYQTLLKLNPGEFEFKYKCGCTWFNDRAAHKYLQNCWGSENSIVVVPHYEEAADSNRKAGAAAPPTA